jgi:hypothetical protein
MLAPIKQAWVKALRSGKYKQGRTYLRSSNEKWCCLGVLADVCGATWEKDTTGHVGKAFRLSTDIQRGNKQYLNNSFLDRIGLCAEDHDKYATMNDEGEKFRTIAKDIEANVSEII